MSGSSVSVHIQGVRPKNSRRSNWKHKAKDRPRDLRLRSGSKQKSTTLTLRKAFGYPPFAISKGDNQSNGIFPIMDCLLRLLAAGIVVVVVHITGSGKGVFDFQAKALPDVAHPISPLLSCNYASDDDRTYDWVLKYQGGSKPAVFLLGSKSDPSLQQ